MIRHEWSNNFHKVSAGVAHKCLSRLAAKTGTDIPSLRPVDVIDEARDEKSPIHEEFEWNDRKAAHQHRVHQAQRLVRDVLTIEVNDDGAEISRRPSFVHTRNESGPMYVPTDSIVTQADLCDVAKREMQSLIDGCIRRLKGYERVFGQPAVKEAVRKIEEASEIIANTNSKEQAKHTHTPRISAKSR